MSRNLWTLSSSSSWCTVKVCSMVILLEYSYCCYCWLIFVTSGLLSLFYCKIVLYLAHWMCHLITQTGTLISDDEVSFFFIIIICDVLSAWRSHFQKYIAVHCISSSFRCAPLSPVNFQFPLPAGLIFCLHFTAVASKVFFPCPLSF